MCSTSCILSTVKWQMWRPVSSNWWNRVSKEWSQKKWSGQIKGRYSSFFFFPVSILLKENKTNCVKMLKYKWFLTFYFVLRCNQWINNVAMVSGEQPGDSVTHTHPFSPSGTPLAAQTLKHLPAMWETWVQSLGQENPMEKEMATLCSPLAWKILWTEEPGRLQSIGSQRVGHDWATSHSPPNSPPIQAAT